MAVTRAMPRRKDPSPALSGVRAAVDATSTVARRRLNPSHVGKGAKAGNIATSVAAKRRGAAVGTASGDGAGAADRGPGAAMSARRP